ncbi:RHS repeat-associated core domain-containing protein [Pseudomonas sp. S2_E01]
MPDSSTASDAGGPPLHSNAFNFSGFLTGGVDPRTGTYTCSLTLGELRSNFLQGPSLPIRLFFNPLQTHDGGFGKGWSLALTRYDVPHGLLTLAGGERYQAKKTSSGLVLDELKLKTFKVLCRESGRFDVVHKSGLIEELEVYVGSELAVPKRIVSANGGAILFDYQSMGDVPALSAVRDATRALLSIERTPGQVVLTLYPGSECAASFTLKQAGDRVSAVQLPDGSAWILSSQAIGGAECLTEVISPLGAREQIRYEAAGHRLPCGAPQTTIPHVCTHTVFPGLQPAITTHYRFSPTNFLGYDDSDVHWRRDGDTLYQRSSDYLYSSVEMLMEGANVHRSIKRTYNKYHLLISQVTRCNQSVVSRTVDYHLEPGKPFTGQPAQFRLPKVQTLRYENRQTQAFREEVTTTLFDAWGNLLKHVAPNGVVTVSTFYPASGAEGCPADPLGFARFEKSRTVRAAADLAQAATTQLQFRYRQIGEPGKPGCDVVLSQQSFYEHTQAGAVLRLQTDLEYTEMVTDPQAYTVLHKYTVRQGGESCATHFEYLLDDTALQMQTIQLGFDETRQESSVSASVINGLKRSEQNEDQGRVDFTYDGLGRETSRTVAAGSEFESRNSSRFKQEKKGARILVTKLDTDAMGQHSKTRYDGLGRVIEVEEQDPEQDGDVVFREVYAAKYDVLGQMTGEKKIDWWLGQRQVFNTVFTYDDWGQVSSTVHPDGRRERRDFDPILRKETTWLEGMGKTVTVYNTFGKPDSIERFDTSNNSHGAQLYAYDGLGRCVEQTDPVGNRTTHAYDVFDRLTLSTLPDGSAVQTTYAGHSRQSLPVGITVAGHTLGRQVFDGLGRLTLSVVGGRTSRVGYEAGCSQPAWKQTPAGERIEYRYEAQLGGVVTQRQATGLLASYEYHPQLGELTRCVEQGRETRLTYDRAGRLKSETSLVGDDGKSVFYSYSLGGRLLRFVDVLGEPHTTGYDDAGRAQSFEHRALNATFSYNTLSQLVAIEARATQGQGSMTTRMAYDDFGREVSRTFQFGDGATQVLSSAYTQADKLTRKTLRHEQAVLRDEQFAYDSRGRLCLYQCTGTQRPCDAQGKEIIRQAYVFDALDNILTLETRFPGGSNLTTFEYSATDPTRLTVIRNSHKDYPAPVTLQYDDNGHLVLDEQGRRISYDALGRLVRVAGTDQQVIRDFHYDARDRLVELAQPSGATTRRYYRNDRSSNDLEGASSRTSLASNGLLLGLERRGTDAGIGLLAVDQQRSVLSETSGTQCSPFAYSPFGHRRVQAGSFSVPGFSGELLDPQSGLYLPGNGYRVYSPTLRRFLSPDNLSPFGAGGLNPYAYCAGDPINRVDPTGHFWGAILSGVVSFIGIAASVLTLGVATPLAMVGLAMGVVSGVTGATAAVLRTFDAESEAADILDWVSIGAGGGSVVAGVGAIGKATVHWGNRLGKAFSKGLSPKRPPSASGIGTKTGNAGSSVGEGFRGNGPWKIKLAEPKSISKQLRRAQQHEYDQFKNVIYHKGVDPAEAVRHMGDPNPKFLQHHSKAWKDLQGNRVNRVDMWEARLGGKDRVTYLVDDTDKLVTVLQVGGHT